MIPLFILILFMGSKDDGMRLFDFQESKSLLNWVVVDDVVMGGRSSGHLGISEDGYGLFYGDVSLENNGGFSSVRHQPSAQEMNGYSACKIRLKGDKKKYQFRIKSKRNDRHSYMQTFETSGDWEIIEIPMAGMYPTFRGRSLDMPNYPIETLEELAFLISNKTAESFRLELDWMSFE